MNTLRIDRPIKSPCDFYARGGTRQLKVNAGFQGQSYRYSAFQGLMDPPIMADRFVMTLPVFRTHALAGLSAVSVTFDDSQGHACHVFVDRPAQYRHDAPAAFHPAAANFPWNAVDRKPGTAIAFADATSVSFFPEHGAQVVSAPTALRSDYPKRAIRNGQNGRPRRSRSDVSLRSPRINRLNS